MVLCILGCWLPVPKFILCARSASDVKASCADEQLKMKTATPSGYLTSKILRASSVYLYVSSFQNERSRVIHLSNKLRHVPPRIIVGSWIDDAMSIKARNLIRGKWSRWRWGDPGICMFKGAMCSWDILRSSFLLGGSLLGSQDDGSGVDSYISQRGWSSS